MTCDNPFAMFQVMWASSVAIYGWNGHRKVINELANIKLHCNFVHELIAPHYPINLPAEFNVWLNFPHPSPFAWSMPFALPD